MNPKNFKTEGFFPKLTKKKKNYHFKENPFQSLKIKQWFICYLKTLFTRKSSYIVPAVRTPCVECTGHPPNVECGRGAAEYTCVIRGAAEEKLVQRILSFTERAHQLEVTSTTN